MAIRALSTAASGMEAQQNTIDVIANNLANVNTAGFKRQRANFADLLYQNVERAGTTAPQNNQIPTGIQFGTGSRLTSTQRIFSQGSLEQTENPGDIAIDGEGFFQVEYFSGESVYTRNGNFHIDSNGRLVTAEGFLLTPAVTIPQNASSFNVGKDGVVQAVYDDNTPPQQVGQVTLARFVNPAGLQALGDNLFRESAASGTALTGTPGTAGFGAVSQRFLELSNVQVVRELVNMIKSQRAFEINASSIKAADEMLQQINGLRR